MKLRKLLGVQIHMPEILDSTVLLSFRRALACGLASALLLLGCSSEESADGQIACEGEQAEGTVCLERVSGRVVGADGAPQSDIDVTVCGPVCHVGVTGADGRFEVQVNSYVLPEQYSVQPHGSPTASTFYYPLPSDLEGGDYQVGDLKILPLLSDGSLLITKTDLDRETVPPEQSATSGEVSMHIAEGTLLRLSIGDALIGDEGRRFRSHELSQEEKLEMTPTLVDARVFALGPFEGEFTAFEGFETEVSLVIKNDSTFAADSEVEVLALGTYIDPSWLTPSQFEKIGTAHVSEDGDEIVFTPQTTDAGLRFVTWVAVRAP